MAKDLQYILESFDKDEGENDEKESWPHTNCALFLSLKSRYGFILGNVVEPVPYYSN